jgi:hypothetical protein
MEMRGGVGGEIREGKRWEELNRGRGKGLLVVDESRKMN